MQRQRFFQTFLQATGRTRVDVVQFVLEAQQGRLGLAVTAKVVGIGQAAIPTGLLFLSKMPNDVATLVKLAAEKGTSFSTILPHPRPQGLAAVDNIQMKLSEVQPAIGQVREQSVACGLVLTGALMKSEDRFTPRFIDA